MHSFGVAQPFDFFACWNAFSIFLESFLHTFQEIKSFWECSVSLKNLGLLEHGAGCLRIVHWIEHILAILSSV